MRRRGPTRRDPAPFLAALAETIEGGLPPAADALRRLASASGVPLAELSGIIAFWEPALAGDQEDTGCDGPVCALHARPGTTRGDRSCIGLCASGPLGAGITGVEASVRSAPADAVFAPRLAPEDGAAPPGDGRAHDWHGLAALHALGVTAALEACADLDLPGGRGARLHEQVLAACARPSAVRQVVVNAAAAEPGIMHERLLLARGPALVIEGALMVAHLIGAADLIVCLPSQWHEAAAALDAAVSSLLVGDLPGVPGAAARVHVRHVPGAFVCREPSALLAALEGRLPWPRDDLETAGPPGLWEQPTLVLDVTAAARLPLALGGLKDREAPGTTERRAAESLLVSLSGSICRPGVHEVRSGTNLRSLLFEGGGGPRHGAIRACTTGGLTGGLLDGSALDHVIETGDRRPQGFIVLDEGADVAAFLRAVLAFFSRETCGRCLPCRSGSQRVEAALTGGALPGPGLSETLEVMAQASACSVGRDGAALVGELLERFPELRSPGGAS